MSININVNIDGFNLEPLREQAKINAERNRARFIESRRIVDAQKRGEKLREIDLAAGKAQIDIEVAPKNSIIRNNNRYKKPSRKEELAASLAPLQETQIGHAVTYRANPTGSFVNTIIAENLLFSPGSPIRLRIEPRYVYQSIGWIVRCGDWSKSITYNQPIAVPSLPPATWNYSAEQATDQFGNTYYKVNWSNTAVVESDASVRTEWLLLPAGGENCILVMIQRYSHVYKIKNYSGYFETYSQPSNFFRPESSLLLGEPWPPTTGVTVLSNQAITTNKAYVCSARSIREIAMPSKLETVLNALSLSSFDGPLIVDDSNSFLGFGFFSQTFTWTPFVFTALNNVHQFINPSLLRSFSPIKPIVITDDRYGWYGNDPTDNNLYYAYSYRDNPFDANNRRRFGSVHVAVPTDAYSASPYPVINAVWDWDEPKYCRTICQALGFTLADLQP